MSMHFCTWYDEHEPFRSILHSFAADSDHFWRHSANNHKCSVHHAVIWVLSTLMSERTLYLRLRKLRYTCHLDYIMHACCQGQIDDSFARPAESGIMLHFTPNLSFTYTARRALSHHMLGGIHDMMVWVAFWNSLVSKHTWYLYHPLTQDLNQPRPLT